MGALKYVIVPKVVVPKIRRYVDVNFSGQVKLIIRDISFNFIKGFIMQGIELKAENKDILRVKSVDIDLLLLPLLRKRIEVRRFRMSGVSFTIGRDTNGVWNFQPLLELGILEEKNAGGV